MTEEAPIILIPNDVCHRAGMTGKFLPADKISLYASRCNSSLAQDKPSLYAPCKPPIFHLKKVVILFEPLLRKLVNESNGTFLAVQQLVGTESADLQSSLLNLSRQYRSIIRACLEDLKEEIFNANTGKREQFSEYVTIFYSVECIWYLCEILYVEKMPGNVVIPLLLEWIRFNIPKHEKNAVAIVNENLDSPELHPHYWDTVIGTILQGRINTGRTLLRMHSAFNTNPFILADEVLKNLPIFSVYGGLSTTEFNVRRKHWQVDCLSKIDANSFAADKNLNRLMKLIIGEEDAWEEITNSFETWYEHLATWLLHTEPTIKSYEIGPFATRCIKKGNRAKLKHLDYVLLALLQGELMQALIEIQNMSESGWFITHLLDILYHSGALESLDEPDINSASRFRESFILEYGTLLMGHESLWQVGVSYLDHCPTQGPAQMETLLCQIPFQTEAKALKIIREAQKRNLPEVGLSIYKILAMRAYGQGRLGNALAWAVKRQDAALSSFLANKYLKEYCKKGDILNTDLLDNLGSSMLVSDRLAFLAKYCEFHKMYQAGEFREAALLIISLIESKITPSYFWTTLLLDALPLLERDEMVFSSNETYLLLHCIEERAESPGLDDKLAILRLAAARNLSRAVMQEAQIQ